MEKLMEKIANAFAKALVVAAEDNSSRFEEGARYYKDNICQQFNQTTVLDIASKAFLIAANDDKKLMAAALDVFNAEILKIPPEEFEPKEVDKPKKKSKRGVIIALAVAVVIIIAIFAIVNNQPQKSTVPEQLSTTVLQRAEEILTSVGWDRDQFFLGNDVNSSNDSSTAGNLKFGDKLQTPAQAVAFLKTDTEGSKALMSSIKEATGATESTISNPGNWITVQPLIDFVYPGNTAFKDGKVVPAGQRSGKANDLFLLFINPDNDKYISVRGACSNPQTVTPRPYVPPNETIVPDTPFITTLEQKSSDPDDYKKPGDDNKKDSGKGTKPLVPEVTKKAESSAPAVDSSVKLNDEVRVTDKVTKESGDETAITAENAKTADEERNSVNVPDAEAKVNPGKSNNGTNEDTISEPTFISN